MEFDGLLGTTGTSDFAAEELEDFFENGAAGLHIVGGDIKRDWPKVNLELATYEVGW